LLVKHNHNKDQIDWLIGINQKYHGTSFKYYFSCRWKLPLLCVCEC